MTSHARLPGFRRVQAPQAVQQPPWPQAMAPEAGAAPWPPAQAPAPPPPRGPTVARADPRQGRPKRRRNGRARSPQDTAAGPPENKTTGLVYLVVLACVAGGLLLTWLSVGGVRWGALLVGGALVAAALARLVLPVRLAGMLAARQRYLDASALAVLGLGMAVIGLLLPPPT